MPTPPTQPAPQMAAGAASFVFDPASMTQAPGSTFAVNVLLRGAQNVYSVPLQVSYDPKILQVVNVSNGGLLSQDGQAVALVHRDDDTDGRAADYRDPATGSDRHFRAGHGSHSDLPGQGERTVHSDHLERRSARSGHAGRRCGRGRGDGHCAVSAATA